MIQDFFHCDAFVIFKSRLVTFVPHSEISSPQNESEKEEMVC